MKETVIQFGEGNFLRGFADYFIHKLNEQKLYDGKVVIVQPIEKGAADIINAQDCADEVREGVNIVKELTLKAAKDKKIKTDISKLVIGLKCGGSDGLSGITANPLVGRTADIAVSMGAAAVMTEVPEMFGAEQILFNRCESRAVFEKSVSLINNFKNYFISHSQPVSENPSPGNKEGGNNHA